MKGIYIILLSFIGFTASGQNFKLWQLEVAPDSNYVIRSNAQDEAEWIHRDSFITGSGASAIYWQTSDKTIRLTGGTGSVKQDSVNYWKKNGIKLHYINGKIGVNEASPAYEFIVKDTTGSSDGNNIAFIGDRAYGNGMYWVRRTVASGLPSIFIQGNIDIQDRILLNNQAGNNLDFLRSNGAGADPTWTSFLSAGLMFNWVLAADGTGGTDGIVDNETVTFKNSTGLTATRSTNNITHTLSAQLQALHNMSTTGYVVRTAANTFVTRSLTGGTGVTFTFPDGVSGATVINVADNNATNELQTLSTAGTTNKNLVISSGNTLTNALVPTGGSGGQALKWDAATGTYGWGADATGAAVAPVYIDLNSQTSEASLSVTATAAGWVKLPYVLNFSSGNGDFAFSANEVNVVNTGLYLVTYSHNIIGTYATNGEGVLTSSIFRNEVAQNGTYSFSNDLYVFNRNYGHFGTALVNVTVANTKISIRSRITNATGSHQFLTGGAKFTITKIL